MHESTKSKVFKKTNYVFGVTWLLLKLYQKWINAILPHSIHSNREIHYRVSQSQ